MGGGAQDRLVKGSLREEKRGEEDVAGHCGRMDWEGDLSEGEAAMASCSKPIKSIFQLGSVNWNFGVKAGAIRGGGGALGLVSHLLHWIMERNLKEPLVYMWGGSLSARLGVVADWMADCNDVPC